MGFALFGKMGIMCLDWRWVVHNAVGKFPYHGLLEDIHDT